MRFLYTLLCCTLLLTTTTTAQLLFFDEGHFEYQLDNAIPAADFWQWEYTSGVEVVSSVGHTYLPLLPGRMIAPQPFGDPGPALAAPAFRLNRLRSNGTPHTQQGTRSGDTLTSVATTVGIHDTLVLSFAYQRAGLPPGGSYDRDWASSLLVGPEPRVIRNGDAQDVVAEPDNLILEIAVTTATGTIPEYLWHRHARMDDSGEFVTDNPAFTLFGAGGYRRGFHEANPDSALAATEGLRSDIYDAGKDQQFRPVILPVPLSALTTGVEGDSVYLFFRFRVDAADNGTEQLPDDADNFYLDNIQLHRQAASQADIALLAAGIRNPYTIQPQWYDPLPVISVANMSQLIASSFRIMVEIEPDVPGIDRELIYRRTTTIPFLRAQQTEDIHFSFLSIAHLNDTFGLTDRDSMTYIITAVLQTTTPDLNPLNDTLRSTFTLYFGDVLAYDPPVPGGRNDVAKAAGVPGKGLNMSGKSVGDETWPEWQFGADGGNASGRIAVRFTLTNPDTLTGYQAFFGSAGGSAHIIFELYRDDNGIPGSPALPGSVMMRNSGLDDLRSPETGGPVMDEYTTYLLPQPVYLTPGTYWVDVAQRNTEGFELGASAFRTGMVTTNISSDILPGDNNTSLMAEQVFRTSRSNNTTSANLAVYSTPHIGLVWKPFMPATGNPGYAYLDAQGTVEGVSTWSRGTWMPMLRPYFGPGKTTTGVERQQASFLPVLRQAIPTPATVSALVRFSLPAAGYTRLTLLDRLGREVARPVDGSMAAGEHTVEIATHTLPAGVYFYRLEAQGHTLVRQMIIVH